MRYDPSGDAAQDDRNALKSHEAHSLTPATDLQVAALAGIPQQRQSTGQPSCAPQIPSLLLPPKQEAAPGAAGLVSSALSPAWLTAGLCPGRCACRRCAALQRNELSVPRGATPNRPLHWCHRGGLGTGENPSSSTVTAASTCCIQRFVTV